MSDFPGQRFGQWSIHTLVAHMPFHPDDLDAVVTLFRRWRTHGQDLDRMAIELWAYYAIYRYCLVFLVSRRTTESVDLDYYVARIFETVREEIPKFAFPDQLIEYVQTTCRAVLTNPTNASPDVDRSRSSDGPSPGGQTNTPGPDASSED